MNWSYLAVTAGEKGVTNSPTQEPMRARCIAQGHDDGACDVLSSPHPGFHCKSGRFRLQRPSGHKKASLTFRQLQRWNTCVMKKGWDSLFGKKRLRSVREKKAWEWNQSLHYMTDNAWCDGSRKLCVHPWWCTWLHFVCLVGQIFTQGKFRALPLPFLCYFNKYGTSKIWLWKLIGVLLDHIPFLWDSAAVDPFHSPCILTELSQFHSEAYKVWLFRTNTAVM